MERNRHVIVPCPFGCDCRLRFPRADSTLYVTCPRCRGTFTWTPLGIVWDERFGAARRRRKLLWLQTRVPKRRAVGVLVALVLVGLVMFNIDWGKGESPPMGASEPSAEETSSGLPVAGQVVKPDTPRVPISSQPTRAVLDLRSVLDPGFSQPKETRRLPNGSYIEPPRLTRGRSSLRVENGTSWDAALKLVKSEGESRITARFVYIRHGESVLLTDIEPGDYTLAWCLGDDWNPASMQFEQALGCYVADRALTFTESVTTDLERTYILSTRASVTLHAVFGGNLGRKGIGPEEFQGL